MDDDTVDAGTPAAAPAGGSTKRTTAAERAAAAERSGAPERIGARLAAARAAAGLDLADIARETRIPLRHLRAIEADAHDDLPAIPYAVGFVRSLARAVGVDSDEAAARFRAETTIVPHAPMPASIEPLDERRLPARGLVLVSVVVLAIILGGLTAYGAGWFDAAPTAVTEAPVTTAPETETASADAPIAAATAAPAAAVPAVPAGTPGSGVSILASEDAWIRVYRIAPETGRPQTVKTGLLAKGERYDLPAGEAGLKLWTGRAGALQLSVDGRPVPSLGGPAETVRNVSLDAEALRARIAPAATTPAPTSPTAP